MSMGRRHSESRSPQPDCKSLGLKKIKPSAQQNPPHTDSEVKSKLDSAEYQAFRKCFADLADGISDPEWISIKLYSEGLIDRNERMKAGNKMHSVLERNQSILSAVEQQILTCPTSKFTEFLAILNSQPSLKHLAGKLENAYSSLATIRGACKNGKPRGSSCVHILSEKPQHMNEGRGMALLSGLERESVCDLPVTQARHCYSESPPVVPDTPLESYACFLKEYYTLHKVSSTKWPYLDLKNYVNLAVICNEQSNKEELNRFREQTIHGCVDDILELKAPIQMKDILKPNCVDLKSETKQFPVTQLLIEGAPGIGKSTFAWEVCQKWSENKLFQEYSLVVLVKFRDKRVQEARSISDLFYHPHPQLQSEIVNDIILTRGHGLLLILEGFDEAPVSKRTMDSLFVRVFMGQELPKATVILTTRPGASAELRQFCFSVNFRRVEIVGFGKKEIDESIQCAFSSKQAKASFNEYLKLYPHIHSMMYVPLNCIVVTHIYQRCQSTGEVVPKTMTQLYSSLIRSLLLRHLKDREEHKDICFHNFKDLPQPVSIQFQDVCKLAYTGIMNAETDLIFQDLPSDFDPLGLMQTCPELYVDSGASVSYNFLHFTIQEYLAAYYISQQSRDEQAVFMKEHIETEKLEVVLRFLAGFSLSELRQGLWGVLRGFGSEDLPIESQLVEFRESKAIKLQILHWLFESQDPLALTSFLGSDSVCFVHDCRSTLLPFDWYVLGYCISHSSCDWKLELSYCKLDSVEAFLDALNLQQDQFETKGKIKQMVFWGSNPSALKLLVTNIPRLLVFQNITHITLLYSKLTAEICDQLCEHVDLLKHLIYLDLYSNPIGRGGTVNLISSLTNFTTIKELNLYNTGIGLEDCKSLSELLANSKYIDVLGIGDNSLSPDSIQAIIDGLKINSCLEKLYMYCSDFSSENVHSLASVLKVNTRLKVLDIRGCNVQGSDFVSLAKALEVNNRTQLQTLFFSGNPIGSTGAVAFADMLTTNESLTKLDMDGCSVEERGALAFSSMLKSNQCLKTLGLNDDSFDIGCALNLIDSVKHNTTLERLELSRKCKPCLFSRVDIMLKARIHFL